MAFKRALVFLGAAVVVAGAQGALAADLGNYGGGGLKDGPMAMPMESPRPSIYLRFDGTYGSYDAPTVTENGIFDLIDSNISSNWGYGGGVGMYFRNGFRGDITVDELTNSDVSANLADPLANLPGVRNFGLSSTVALANLYYDFDTGSRFTPYIGFGLGFTHNRSSSGTVTDPCGCLTGTIDSDSNTSVAGAAMAGFSVRLRGGEQVVQGSFKDGPMTVNTGRGLHLDVGYRFLYLGEAVTGPVNATYTAAVPGGHAGSGSVSQDPLVEDIHAHELRIGLRYDIN